MTPHEEVLSLLREIDAIIDGQLDDLRQRIERLEAEHTRQQGVQATARALEAVRAWASAVLSGPH